jgi:hypothetical protein
MAPQNAHGASIAMSDAVGRWSGRAGGFDEHISLEPDICFPFFSHNGRDPTSIHLHIRDPAPGFNADAGIHQKSSDFGLHGGHIV